MDSKEFKEVVADYVNELEISSAKKSEYTEVIIHFVAQLVCAHSVGRGSYCTKCGKFPLYLDEDDLR